MTHLWAPVGADADHHEQAQLFLLEQDFEVLAVDPEVVEVVPEGSRSRKAFASSCHWVVSRVIEVGGSPAPDPRNCSSAGPKSLMASPYRYSSGKTSFICL